jgi:ribosomal protein S18 acetylase RimI-like enzyme
VIIRAGEDGDVEVAALLHADAIHEGFLPLLGTTFLIRLYRRIVRSAGSFLLVAEEDGLVVGQAAATEDVRSLYKEFLVRDGVVGALVAAPQLSRHWRSALETFRYASRENGLPKAELLAVAVAPHARGRGIGRALVTAANDELKRRGVDNARVVVGSSNAAALRMYTASGYTPRVQLEVHKDRPSEVLTWS